MTMILMIGKENIFLSQLCIVVYWPGNTPLFPLRKTLIVETVMKWKTCHFNSHDRLTNSNGSWFSEVRCFE